MSVIIGFAALIAIAGAIPSEYARNITVYHVNPYSEGVYPINMDTADAAGDIFFDFRSKVLPLECAGPHPHSHDCTNKEVTAPDLVITELVLEVDDRFGDYARCNICVNGSLGPGSHDPKCKTGEYYCTCGGYSHQQPCKSPAVGYENVTEHFASMGCQAGMKDWECWRGNVVKKTGGKWYSTRRDGYCGDGSSPAAPDCTWRVVKVEKVVNKSCSDNSVYNFLETYDSSATSCFKSCTDSGIGPARNVSSLCWTRCFFQTVLGPNAGSPSGAVAGVPQTKLLQMWEKAFTSSKVAEGGCPGLPPKSGQCWQPAGDGSSVVPTNQLCESDADCTGGHCNPTVSPDFLAPTSETALIV